MDDNHEDGVMVPYHSAARLQPHTLVSARSITALILRIKALVTEWIKVEVDPESITGAESIISDGVVETFISAGGDLREAVPFALLEARKEFTRDASYRAYTLNDQRALVCEILARQVVAAMEGIPKEVTEDGGAQFSSSHISLSKRFVQLDEDGDEKLPASAMESAVDQNCINFLASVEAQRCAEDLWKGKLTQQFAPSGMVFFEPHRPSHPSFLSRIDSTRLAVPQYSYYAGLAVHAALIVIYTFSTLEYTGLDAWEIVLWIFAAGYLIDDMNRWFKMRGIDKIISFWVLVDLCTDALFVTAFIARVTGWLERDDEKSAEYQLLAFQFLSCIAPLLWMQLLKLADGFQYFGVIQIVILRMLQETAAFFLLLLLTAIGFAQSFFALDAADGRRVENSGSYVVNMLVAAILGQPDFEAPSEKFGQPFGTILFYVYSFITVMLLANILVAFFASAYDKTVDDATDVFRAYFCSKVISSIRAPDQFVYLPPFNIIEAFLIAPLEPILPRKVYANINRVVQSVLFCIPLLAIALYESQVDGKLGKRIRMEMLDDIPEERIRRLREVCGMSGSVEDPSFDAYSTSTAASPASPATLTRDQFETAAEAYVKMADQGDGSGGAQVYAVGWKWEKGSNPPHTACLHRTLRLPSASSKTSQDGRDAALLDSLAETDREGEDATASISIKDSIQITQTISYSSTWKVPILYLEGVDANGSPLSVHSLCSSPLFLSKDSAIEDASSPLTDGLAVFPTVSMGENPANGHNSAYLHPCETAKWMGTLLADKTRENDSKSSYIESFIMLCSSVVEMRSGAQGDLHKSKKILPLASKSDNVALRNGKSSYRGKQDWKITTVAFADLVKSLPAVRSQEDEESEDAVTTKDLLKEIKLLREEMLAIRSENDDKKL